MANEKQRGGSHRILVNARLSDVGKDDSAPSLYAYLFSSAGDLLDRKPVEKNAATLEAPAAGDRRSFRVLVGPETGAEEGVHSELMRRGAVEQTVIHEFGKDLKVDFQVDRGDWLNWILGRCCVKGRVLKRVGTGASAVDLNVCDATVEIWEVDPWWIIIDRVPWDILKKIREIVLEEVPIPPWGPPDPGPLMGPIDPVPWMESLLIKGQPMAMKAAQARFEFPDHVIAAARIGTDRVFKEALVLNPELFYPIFCWRWPWFVRKTKVCQTVTDCHGRFRCCFYHGWFNPDTPDLWFRVRQNINGVDTVVYERYPVSCHTYWNYVCGTEVTLYATNPNAITCCNEPPIDAEGNWVVFEAVGATSPRQIRGMSLDPMTTVAGDGHDKGWTRGNGPFGGLIRPRLRFRDTLIGMGVLYYRVSWAPMGTDPAITDPNIWKQLDSTVNRHYIYTVGIHPTYGTWEAGPNTVGVTTNLFKIPPSAPPLGDWASPPGYEVDDLTSAYFNTYSLIPAASAGKFDLKVELFDAAGAMVNLAGMGIDWYVPSVDDFNGTIFTDDATLPGLNLVHGNAFVVTLHVDNNVCNALIAPPEISGTGADPNCGGLTYTSKSDSVLMAFEASHPNQFATYSFHVYRGHANLVATDPVVPPGAVGAGAHSVSKQVVDIIDNCDAAAFSENLYVAATAIDGWRRLSEYDRGDVFAFMLVTGP